MCLTTPPQVRTRQDRGGGTSGQDTTGQGRGGNYELQGGGTSGQDTGLYTYRTQTLKTPEP